MKFFMTMDPNQDLQSMIKEIQFSYPNVNVDILHERTFSHAVISHKL